MDVRKRMAVVEIICESCTFIKCSSDRRSIKGKNGEHIIRIFITNSFYLDLWKQTRKTRANIGQMEYNLISVISLV